MPEITTLLQVLASSPSDLVEERQLLEDVIAEYNLGRSEERNVQLELIKWESHTRPGFGDDPQDVINQQIGDKYDIFIGMMWGRFGSPTERAESGTREEFERAFARFEASAGAVQIMFYFKDAPLPPSKIDPLQLQKVQEFKQQISLRYGGLYHEFASADEFEKLARIHLSKVVQDCIRSALPALAEKRLGEPIQSHSSGLETFNSLGDQDDEGVFDLSEEGSSSLGKCSEILEHIGASITQLGDGIRERVSEINDLKARNLLPNNKLAKRVADAAAADMELYVERMLVDLPAITAEYSRAMEKFGKMAMISGTDFNEPLGDLLNLLDTLKSSRVTMSNTKKIMSDMRNAMAQTPRMTTSFNHARRRAVAITDDLVLFIDSADTQTAEVETVIAEIVQRRTQTVGIELERKHSSDRDIRERDVDEAIRRFRNSIPTTAPSYEEVIGQMYDDTGVPV